MGIAEKIRRDSMYYAKGARKLRKPKRNPALECTIGGRSTFDVESSLNECFYNDATTRSSSSSASGVKCKSVLKRTKTPDFKPKSRTKVKFQTTVEFVNETNLP